MARSRRERAKMEADDLVAPFFQKWRRDVDGGEGGVNLQLPAGLGLRQLLGTLLVPQLRWWVRRGLLLFLSRTLIYFLNFLSPLSLVTEFGRRTGCVWRRTGRALVCGV